MGKYFDNNASSLQMSSMGKVRNTPEYQQRRLQTKQKFYADEASKWMSDVASLFDGDRSTYNPEVFSTKAKAAGTLKRTGSSLLSRMEENRAELGDEFVDGFRKNLEEQTKNLDVAETYYSTANPYQAKYMDYSAQDASKQKDKLLGEAFENLEFVPMVGTNSPFERSERTKEIDALITQEAIQQSKSADFNSPRDARRKAQELLGNTEATEQDRAYAEYLNRYADEYEHAHPYETALAAKDVMRSDSKAQEMISKGAEAIESGAYGGETLNSILEDDMDTVRYLIGKGDEGALQAYIGNYYNIKSEEVKKGLKVKDPAYTAAYNLGKSFYKEVGYSPNLTEDELEVAYYLVGKELQSNGYNEAEYVPELDEANPDEVQHSNEYGSVSGRYETQKSAEHTFDKLKGNTALELMYKLGSGFLKNPHGIIRSLQFGNKNTAFSEYELVSQMIQEDLDGAGAKLPDWLGGYSVGQAAGSMLESFGQMAPSMALGAIPGAGPVLSSATFGMSAGGNAKMDLMREGYDEATSTAYGVLVGVAEAGLQQLMGGIKFGKSSTVSSVIEKAIKGIKNGVVKYAAKVGSQGVLEAVEEGTQEILDPVFRYLVGVDEKDIDELKIGDVLFASMQGFIMSGGMSNAEAIAGATPYLRGNATEWDIETVNNLIQEGLTKDSSTDAYQLSVNLNRKIQKAYEAAISKEMGAEDAYREALRRVSREEFAELQDAVMSSADADSETSIKARLKELGETGNLSVLTQAIYKKARGIKLTSEESSVLKKSKYGQRVLNEYKDAGTGDFSSNWTEDVDGSYERDVLGYKKNTAPVGAVGEVAVGSEGAARTDALPETGIDAAKVISETKVKPQSTTPLATEVHPRGIAVELAGGTDTGIVGIELSGDGVTTLYRTYEGKTVKASAVVFDGTYESSVLEIAQSYDTMAANALLEASVKYKEKAGSAAKVTALESAFVKIAAAAQRQGIDLQSAIMRPDLTMAIRELGVEASAVAINAGLAKYNARYAEEQKRIQPEKKNAAAKKSATVKVSKGINISSGVKRTLEKIAKLGNVSIVVEHFGAEDVARGYYHNNEIHLNADTVAEYALGYVAIHEAVHHIRANNPTGYSVLEKFVTNYLTRSGRKVDALVSSIQKSRAKHESLSYEEALEELVCNSLSDIATDENAMATFLELDKSEQKTLLSVLRDIAKKIKAWATNFSGQEYRGIIRDAETLQKLATELNEQLKAVEGNAQTQGKKKNLYAGFFADTAPSTFIKAERMSENGVDSETIRKETGWFKGLDGKWRFEIDDSEAEFHREGDVKLRENPRYLRLLELSDKKTLTSAEQTELSKLEKEFEDDVWRTKWRLDDYLKHDKLFASYPLLGMVNVDFQNLPDSTGGYYSSKSGTIVLNSKITNEKQLLSIVLHEIQHNIQHREGFSTGASPEYWQSRIDSGFDSRSEDTVQEEAKLRTQYDEIVTNEPEFYGDMKALEEMHPDVPRAPVNWDTLETIGEDPVEWQRYDSQRDALVEKYSEEKVYNFMLLQDKLRRVATRGARTAHELYHSTAGEVEARDVQNRQNLTDEQRKNTRPDIDREDVVFANSQLSMDYLGEDEILFNPNKLDFASVLKDVLKTAEAEDSRYVYLGRFPSEIVEIIKEHYDIKDLPVVMNYRDAYLAMEAKENGRFTAQGVNYHNLGEKGFVELKNNFANPDYVIKHKVSEKLELIYPQKDYKGRTVYCVIILNTDTKHSEVKIAVHVMATVYGKSKIEKYIDEASKEGRLIYRKEESPKSDSYVRYEGYAKSDSSFTGIVAHSNNNVKKNSYADELVLRAEEYFGTTRNWNETGYILTNGIQLDFSGKKLGAPGGNRTVDHREILDSYDEEAQNNMSGVEAMVDFMRRGNIRISPENDGINISVLPTKAQESTLRDFITRARGEVILDIDNEYGDTVVSVEYPRGTSSSKILNDIRQYFEDGTEPYVSDIGQYRYSRSDIAAIDAEYMEAVESGDIATQERLVEEAAKRAGYDTTKLYHGTGSFGFTEFDLGKMDDGRSIFLTNSEDVASTYSGVTGVRKISERKKLDVENMSGREIADHLTRESDDANYRYCSNSDITQIKNDAQKAKRKLEEYLDSRLREYRVHGVRRLSPEDKEMYDRLQTLADYLKKSMLPNTVQWFQGDDYTSSFMHKLLKLTNSSAFGKRNAEFRNLYNQLDLLRTIKNKRGAREFVVEEEYDGTIRWVYDIEEAADYLRTHDRGNYALYAKTDNFMEVNAGGEAQHWNKLNVDGVGVTNTRGLAEYVRRRGYDGVIIRNLIDNGGRNDSVSDILASDIYIVFNPQSIKSADAITYDELGRVVPLSARFNPRMKDMRYSYGDEEVDLWELLDPEDNGEYTERSELLDGYIQTAGVLLEKTRGVSLKKNTVRRIANNVIREFTGKYNTELAEAVEAIVQVASDSESVWAQDVVGEIAAIMKEAATHSEFRVDDFRSEREDVVSLMNQVGTIYLSEDQIAELESEGRSINWFRQKMFGKVKVAATNAVNKTSVSSLEHLYMALSEMFPEWFDDAVYSVRMPFELIRQLDKMKPRTVSMANSYMMSLDEIAVQMASEIISRVVDAKYQASQDEEVKRLKVLNKQRMGEWLDKQDGLKHAKNIERYASSLIKWITTPTKQNSVPDIMQQPVLEMLQAFDFTRGKLNRNGEVTKHDSAWGAKMEAVAGLLDAVGAHQDTSFDESYGNLGYLDVDPELIRDMREFAAESGGRRLSELTGIELGTLDGIMMRLKNAITSANRLHQNALAAEVSELAEDSIAEFKGMKHSRFIDSGRAVTTAEKVASVLDQSLRFSTADAFTVQKMLGYHGGSVIQELFEGYEKTIVNIEDIQEWSNKHIDLKKVEQWRKDVKRIVLSDGSTITLTVPQIMELYALSKREQAQGHIYGAGIVPEAEVESRKVQIKNDTEMRSFTEPYGITLEDMMNITSLLTEEQKKLANVMQEYLTTVIAELGNEVTMKRFLYRAYTTKNYWPINVVGEMTKTTDQTLNMVSLYKVGNPGFSKQTVKGASNAIVIHDIFTSFAKHCGNMALLNGLSIPLSDALKWYNYTNGNTGTKGEMKSALSRHANEWFVKFLTDLNNQQIKAAPDTAVIDMLIKNSKSAAIWGNTRVVLQQFTAYSRAYTVLDAKHLINPQALLRPGGIEKARKYCPIAWWKSQGFFTTDIGRSLEDIILPTETVFEKVRSAGFKATAKADELTWGMLWNACELQVLEKNKNVERDTEECNNLTAQLLTEVINETQVVDTPFHRAQIRRNTDMYSKLLSAFMDEPIKSYNMLRNAIFSGEMSKGQRAKTIGRAVIAFITTSAFCAVAETAWDMVRKSGDDDDDTFWEKFLGLYSDNVLDNLNVFKLHPIINNMWSIAEGWTSSGLDENGLTALTDTLSHLVKRFYDDDYKRTLYADLYEAAKAISYISGIGVHTVLKDIVGVVNLFLPDGQKMTSTAPTKGKLASEAVISLLEGDKEQYQSYYDDILENCGGDKVAADKLIYGALSKTEDARIAYEAYRAGDKATYENKVNELVEIGFDFDVVVKATNSLESFYNTQISNAAEAQRSEDAVKKAESLQKLYEIGFSEDMVEEDLRAELEKPMPEKEPELMYDTAIMVSVLEQGDTDGFREIVEYLKENGKSETTLRSAVSRSNKSAYVDAYISGNVSETERIKKVLESSELYPELEKNLSDWVYDELRDQYKATDNPDERVKIRQMLWDTGRWETLAELDKRLAKWREE